MGTEEHARCHSSREEPSSSRLRLHRLDVRTAAVDPCQEVRLLQRQVEEGVLEVPEQDVPERLVLVGQQPVPQRQSRTIPGDPQQEDGPDGRPVPGQALLSPGPTYNLQTAAGDDGLL